MASKPIVVISCPPEHGHTNPLLPHAKHLVDQGHEVHLIAGDVSKDAVQKTGATFYPVENVVTPEKLQVMLSIPEGLDRFAYAIKVTFIDLTPGAMAALKTVLEDIREKNPNRDVVIVSEYAAMGALPFILGAPLPKGYDRFPKVITFSTVPLPITSVDTAPFGPGLPPDSSEEGRARNAAMFEGSRGFQDGLVEYANTVYETLGAKDKVTIPFLDFCATAADLTVQPCSLSLEYPRSDLSPKINYIGGLARQELGSGVVLPAWWRDVLAAKESGKKIVFVTQGTFMLAYDMLLIPTIEALADNDKCFVVGVLGQKGAQLEGVSLPANARVADYLSYEAILPHAHVAVSNAGYGGFMKSVMYGVPMVLAGAGQDKAEVCMRGEWAGIAVNLRTATPSVEELGNAVNKILADGTFKARCVEIQHENEELGCLSRFEGFINGAV